MQTVAALNNQKLWKPHKKQAEFLGLPVSIFEGFFGGSAGPGKTETLLMYPFYREWYKHPRFKGIIFRRSFPELEESLIDRSKKGLGKEGPSYYDLGGTYNESKHVWTFESGATIRFAYSDREDDVRQHDTAEYNYLAFDELTHFTYFQYIYLTHRVRSVVPELPAIVRSASNPGNIGHAWVRDRFIAPARNGFTKIVDKKSKQSRIYIPARLEDNPSLNEDDPGYKDRLQLLPEAERKAKYEGDWWTFSGQVFTEFREQHISDEPDNALHVIPSFKIPSYWPKILAVDWGYDHNTWAGWAAIAPDGKVFVYREYCINKTSIRTWAADIRRLSQFDENLVEVVLDPSAWQERGLDQTIAIQFAESSGFDPVRADNDRIGGKQLLHDFLRWKPRPARYIPRDGYDQEAYNRIFRMYGPLRASDYAKLFQPDPPETNLPRLQIFKEACPVLINTLPLCQYEETKSENPLRVEDVKKFHGDDAYDGLRYLLKSVDYYLSGLEQKHRQIQELGKIINKLEQTGDQTSFYRNMEFYEAKQRESFAFLKSGPGKYGRALQRPKGRVH